MRRLLWVGDANNATGSGKATLRILESLRAEWDVHVLGLNVRGDYTPNAHPYPVYAAMAGGDPHGIGRLLWVYDKVDPDVIVIQQDSWNIPAYLKRLELAHREVPVIGVVAVDGRNCHGAAMNGLTHAIFWTEFGLQEAREGGYSGSASVIPLGVDLTTFGPYERREARVRMDFPDETLDAFVVGCVNRNHVRKRLDLTIRYFARWVKEREIGEAYLYLHAAPTGDEGYDLRDLADYYGVIDRVLTSAVSEWNGYPDDRMADLYNCFDVQITTTAGEGFGLTTFEGMACGVPQIVPQWSALGELTSTAAKMVPCTSVTTAPRFGAIGGVPDEAAFIEALDTLHTLPKLRRDYGNLGRRLAESPRYRWEEVGRRFITALNAVLPGVTHGAA